MTSTATQGLIALVVTVLIIFRFARRELVERTINLTTLWIRPLLLLAITGYLVYLTSTVDPDGLVEALTDSAIGGVLGVIAGVAIVQNTTFRSAGKSGAVMAKGNKITFGIWVAALALRLLARFVIPHGADPRTQLPLNCGTVMMATAAFVVIAIAFVREIRRHHGVPATSLP